METWVQEEHEVGSGRHGDVPFRSLDPKDWPLKRDLKGTLLLCREECGQQLASSCELLRGWPHLTLPRAAASGLKE